jgi:hypothetical protein
MRKCLKNMVPPTRIERAARGLGNLSDPEDGIHSKAPPNKETDDLEKNSDLFWKSHLVARRGGVA